MDRSEDGSSPPTGDRPGRALPPASGGSGDRYPWRALATSLAVRLVQNRDHFRHRLLRHLWIDLKRFGAPAVELVDLAHVRGLEEVQIEGPVWRHDPLIVAALCRLAGCRTVFEFGTYLGETAWLIAHNNPRVHVYTLDLPGPEAVGQLAYELTDPEYFERWERGRRFAGTPEAVRITQLLGDSATFDFSPYRGRIDLVYVDASHNYPWVRSDTEAAFQLLSERGTVVWDDYTHYPGVFRFLNQLSPRLDHPIVHVSATRLAVYTRLPLLDRRPLPASRLNDP